MSCNRQRGVALLMALVVLAISAALAAAMVWDRTLDQKRTANILHGDQALEYALGTEAWSEQILMRDARQGQTDYLGEVWATRLPPLPVEGGQIVGQLDDMQGRFNLNNLVRGDGKPDTAAVKQFERLLVILNISADITPAVVDWIDPDQQPQFPGGAEDEVYSRQEPPYHAANREMQSISELLEVQGVTPDIYQQLAPYITALPSSGVPVNVNTASAPIIASLAEGIGLDQARSIVQSRGKQDFKSSAGFEQAAHIKSLVPVSVRSSYFRLTSKVDIGSTRVTLYSLLQRRGNTASVVRRSFGVL